MKGKARAKRRISTLARAVVRYRTVHCSVANKENV
jgi:hypothetical protein